LPSAADLRVAGLDAVLDEDLDVVLEVVEDRAPDLVDGRLAALDFLGGNVNPSPAELLPFGEGRCPYDVAAKRPLSAGGR
jgi:hypothetical protein